MSQTYAGVLLRSPSAGPHDQQRHVSGVHLQHQSQLSLQPQITSTANTEASAKLSLSLHLFLTDWTPTANTITFFLFQRVNVYITWKLIALPAFFSVQMKSTVRNTCMSPNARFTERNYTLLLCLEISRVSRESCLYWCLPLASIDMLLYRVGIHRLRSLNCYTTALTLELIKVVEIVVLLPILHTHVGSFSQTLVFTSTFSESSAVQPLIACQIKVCLHNIYLCILLMYI